MYEDREDIEELKEICKGECRDIVEIDCDIFDGEKGTVRKFRIELGFAVICAVAFLLLICFISSIGVFERAPEPSDEQIEKNEKSWRGAFASESVSDTCLCSSVSIRAGSKGEYSAPTASGVVIDSNGWIATSASLLSSASRGRIYVIDRNGSEYAVEGIVEDRECGVAFLQIDKQALAPLVNFGSDGLCDGERLVAVSSLGAPSCLMSVNVGSFGKADCVAWLGENAKRREGQIYTDIYFEDSAVGSPIFDGDGRLVGMSLFPDTRYVSSIEQILESFENIK